MVTTQHNYLIKDKNKKKRKKKGNRNRKRENKKREIYTTLIVLSNTFLKAEYFRIEL